MSLLEHETDPLPPPGAPPPRPRHRAFRSSDRIVAGVAAGLAESLGIAPAWVRVGFVVLGLFGGFGVVAYLAAYLLLPAGPDAPPVGPLRRALGLAALPVWLLLLSGSWRTQWAGLDRPWGLALLLIGVAVALWRPRARIEGSDADGRALPPPSAGTPAAVSAPAAAPAGSGPRRKRPRSPVGRLFFGAALLAAAAGVAITAGSPTGLKIGCAVAALVCGAGLVAGARFGPARWLIVPALLFAAASVAGAATEGLHVHQSLDGSSYSWSATDHPGATPPTHIDKGAGHVFLQLDQVDRPVRGVIRLGHGTVAIDASDAVRLEVHARVGIGRISTPGGAATGYRRSTTYVVGPSTAPLVRYDVAVGFGHIELGGYAVPSPAESAPGPLPPGVVGTDEQGALLYQDGTRQLPDGTVVLTDGTQVQPDGTRILGAEARVLANGDVLLTDGTSISRDGTVRLPSGETIQARPTGATSTTGPISTTPATPTDPPTPTTPSTTTSATPPATSGR